MTLFTEINAKITGRLALFDDEETDALYKMASLGGDHIEIGTLWGGTAIVAGLAKVRGHRRGKVYTIDYMRGGFWDNGDPACDYQRPTPEAIVENVKAFSLQDRVVPVRASSSPFPLLGLSPATALIDGGHEYEPCLQDWDNLKEITRHFIAFHDYGGRCPGVVKVVNEVAMKDKDWRFVRFYGTLAVFKHE